MHIRYRPVRIRRLRRGITRQQRRGIVLIGLSLILLIFTLGISRNLVPMMTEVAIHEAYELVTTAINDAIAALLLDGSMSYASLIHLEKDASGSITALTTDMARINMLQATITNDVIARIGDLDGTSMRIPLGNILGSSILSGRGPGIGFRVVMLGNPSATFSNEFVSAGINQTMHQIMLEIAIQVNVLVPGHVSQETITMQMLIAETVIVGDVPGMFGQFHVSA